MKVLMRSTAVCLASLAGCGGPLPDWYEESPWVWLDLEVQTLPAFDPKLDDAGELPISVRPTGYLPEGCAVRAEVRTADGAVVPLAEVDAPVGLEVAELSWDGRDGEGFVVDPGTVQITADLWCGSQVQGFGEARTQIVRLGMAQVDFLPTEAQVPLVWHKTDLRTRKITGGGTSMVEWRGGDVLDGPDGDPRPGPGPWSHAAIAPWGDGDPLELDHANVPVAYVAGSTFSVRAVPGGKAVSQRSGVQSDARGPLATWDDLPTIRIVGDELRPSGEPAWVPGAPAEFTSTTTLPSILGRRDLELTWRFEALRDDEWVAIPGSTSTVHRVYTLAGPTMVPDGTANGGGPAATWVGVLEDVMPAVEGIEADDAPAIMDALRVNLHTDPYIKYNPSDTAYSTFAGRYIYWDRIWVEMSDFLDRQQGIDLYCHSVACVVSSQANHLGLETEYITIVNEAHPETGRTFRTWLTRAAGTTTWRRWTFNSHGITTLDGRVWDAAVDVDSDDNPGSEPVVPLSPMGCDLRRVQRPHQRAQPGDREPRSVRQLLTTCPTPACGPGRSGRRRARRRARRGC